jgi:heme/copper-type cytochrome/quinol oxidase subunit 3
MNSSRHQTLNRPRAIALMITLLAAVISLLLLFHASKSRPPVLMAMFVVWVSIPFAALLIAYRFSSRWPLPSYAALYIVMSVSALGSAAAYGYDAWKPRKAQAAFVYIMVPPVSLAVSGIAVLMAHLLTRKSASNEKGSEPFGG